MKAFGRSPRRVNSSCTRGLVYLLTIISLAFWLPASFAQSDAAADSQDETASQEQQDATSDVLEEVVVTGHRFLAEDTSGTTGLPIQIERVPQSISLVNKDFIDAIDAQTLADIAQYTPGAVFDGNPGGFTTLVKLRGFKAGHAIDGLNVGWLDYEPDFATLDRLEVVRGPTSVVYGAADPGGIINQVTKSARTSTPDYIRVLGGSWGRWRTEGQVSGELNGSGTLHGIAVAAYEQADSFMQRVSSEKKVIYGGFDADLTDNLTGYIHAGYERYSRTPFDGIPLFPDGTAPKLPRSYFIGSGDFDMVTPVTRVNGGLDWEASSALSVSFKIHSLDSDTTGEMPLALGLEPDGFMIVDVNNITETKIDSLSAGLSALYRLDDHGLDGSFITVAANYQRYDTNQAGTIPFMETWFANIYDGVDAIEDIFNARSYPGIFDYSLAREMRYLTLSSQANFQVSERVSLLAGLSWMKPEVGKQSGAGAWQDFSGDNETSLRLAVMAEPVDDVNLYLSYSESYMPQLYIDVRGDVLPPLTGEQYEAGVKYVSPGRRLLLTGALFEVRQLNQAAFDANIDLIDRFRPLGEVRHRGLELQAIGAINDHWQVNAGLALLDPTIRKDLDETIIGATSLFLPETTANLFASYEFDGGLSLSGGFRYVGSVKTSYDGSTIDIPSYTLADASLGYTLDRWRLQLNAQNLFDEEYFVNNYQTLFFGNAVGEPRSFSISAHYEF